MRLESDRRRILEALISVVRSAGHRSGERWPLASVHCQRTAELGIMVAENIKDFLGKTWQSTVKLW